MFVAAQVSSMNASRSMLKLVCSARQARRAAATRSHALLGGVYIAATHSSPGIGAAPKPRVRPEWRRDAPQSAPQGFDMTVELAHQLAPRRQRGRDPPRLP